MINQTLRKETSRQITKSNDLKRFYAAPAELEISIFILYILESERRENKERKWTDKNPRGKFISDKRQGTSDAKRIGTPHLRLT